MLFFGLGLVAVVAVALVVAVVTLVVRRPGRDTGRSLRSFFRYGILLVLMVLAGTGVTGLVTFADPDGVTGPEYVAFMLACLIVGGPGLFLVSRRVRRDLDRSERAIPGWEIYLVVAESISLVTAATGAYFWGEGLAEARFRVSAAGVMVVWGAIWYLHHALAGRRGRAGRLRYGVLLGCLIGLATGSAFAILFLERVLGRLYDGSTGVVVVVGTPEPILSALIGLVIWGSVWVRYWWFIWIHEERTVLRRAYAQLLGVVGGLLVALTGVWRLAYRILDWLVGDSPEPAWSHFDEMPLAVALTVVGGVVWYYHRTVLASRGSVERAEVDRVHEYTVAGVGLVTSVSGLASVIAASVQALLPADLVNPSHRSDLVAAVTLLLVGGSLWWRYWTSAQRSRRSHPAAEIRSPTRRIYLVCVFGAGGVLAIGSLFVLVFRLLTAPFEGAPVTTTLFTIRWPLALALAVGMAAGYHRAIRRADLAEIPDEEAPRATLRSVVLVGSGGREIAELVEKQTGVSVRVWERSDTDVALSAGQVMAAIESADHERLLIVARPDGAEVIPYTE